MDAVRLLAQGALSSWSFYKMKERKKFYKGLSEGALEANIFSLKTFIRNNLDLNPHYAMEYVG